jgi:hypothetical protein
LLGAALAVAVVAFYAWSLHVPSWPGLRETQSDYYALQVHGWRKGTLAMDVAPHPDLRVEYPNRITHAAPFLLDASYYQGKYYLYFGPVPALVLLLPYNLVTGWDLPLPLVALLFAAAGFGLSVAWFRVLQREFFPSAPVLLQFVGMAVLGLGNLAPVVLVRPLFYEVAALAGYAFTQAGLLAATLAWLRPARAGRWLLAASLCAGLAAGCRPNLIVGAAVYLPLTVARRSPRAPAACRGRPARGALRGRATHPQLRAIRQFSGVRPQPAARCQPPRVRLCVAAPVAQRVTVLFQPAGPRLVFPVRRTRR